MDIRSGLKWYCMKCSDFLPIEKFKAGTKRWICKMHYNEKWHKIKMEQWERYPENKQASITWQMAYRDSATVFRSKIKITPVHVLALLQENNIQTNIHVRLLPLIPIKPLSKENYLLVTSEIRKVLCRVWKQSHCIEKYSEALGHYNMK